MYGSLPTTGLGLAVGGVYLGGLELVAAAVGLIALGAASIRLGWRR